MAMVVLVCLALLVVTTVIHYEVLRGLTVLLPGLGIKPRAKLIVVIIAAFLAHALEIALYALAIWGLHLVGLMRRHAARERAEFLPAQSLPN